MQVVRLLVRGKKVTDKCIENYLGTKQNGTCCRLRTSSKQNGCFILLCFYFALLSYSKDEEFTSLNEFSYVNSNNIRELSMALRQTANGKQETRNEKRHFRYWSFLW